MTVLVDKPDCGREPADCRISVVTAARDDRPEGYAPIYDGAGVLTNPVQSLLVQTATCSVCAAVWEEAVDTSGSVAGKKVLTPPTAPEGKA